MTAGTVICTGNFELPDKNAAAHRVLNNARLFKSVGLNTVFLGVCRDGPYFSGIVRRDYGVGFDIYEQAYPRTTRQWAAEIFDVTNLRELVRRYPDTVAVLLYNTQYATLLAVRRAFAGQGIRVLYDCTEWNAFTEGSFIKRKIKSLDSRLIEKRLARRCDGVIAVSTAIRDAYKDRTPVLLLPPLVDTRDGIWRQQPARHERFTFCYAGSPSDKDRLDLVLSAFSRLPAGDASLRIIGVTYPEYVKACPQAVPDAPSADVCFTGRLSHEETVREILGCGCFVFLREPSRRNTAGFPTKFTEAFTCGARVITTAVSDVPAYADDACIVLPAATPDGVLAAMREARALPPRPRALRETFDYRNRTDDCREWFERILCKKD